MSAWLWPALFFASALCTQPFVAADPVTHVLVQMPLLALAGATLPVRPLPREVIGAAFVLALVTVAVWMLPRSVDAALTGWAGHVAKFLTLPLLFGLPLALSWNRLGPVLRGFVKAQCISMLLLLAFLYTHAPLRICNSYLVSDQQRLGLGFAVAAIALALAWIVPAFVAPGQDTTKGNRYDLRRYS